MSVGSGSWQEVKRIFHSARERTGADRVLYLETACRQNPELRAEIESLLRALRQDEDVLEQPAATFLDFEENELQGRMIGPYRLQRQIGCGGMGTVWLAVRNDGEFQKSVAIKLVNPALTRGDVLRRFREERQILAGLDHANIVKLLDGGTTLDGYPYLVMDYVEGAPIDQFCAAHGLSLDQRLTLFIAVCGAVHYAHQNLIAHRDLKPSNILVTTDGAPKLLDFGVAKLLSATRWYPQGLTLSNVKPMTPEFASPEQFLGQSITTATDIYSLGVLLCRLLTGHSPYRLKAEPTLTELERAVCEEEPLAMSSIVGECVRSHGPDCPGNATAGSQAARRLRGDLDRIAIMAMRKEPQQRYASVEQLTEDIRRHLQALPVVARKPTLGYRASKFVRRYKAGLAVAAVVAVSLLTAVATTVWEARVAEGERLRAERRFAEVREVAHSFLFEFHDAIQTLPGSTPARQLIVQRALKYLNNLSRDAGSDVGLKLELADAYRKVGDVQGNPSNANLGDAEGAMASYRNAAELCEEVVAKDVGNAAGRRLLALSYLSVGDMLSHQNLKERDYDEALHKYRQAEEALRGEAAGWLAGGRPLLADVYDRIGALQGYAAAAEDALQSHRQALAIREQFAADHPEDQPAQQDLAASYHRIGALLTALGALPEALDNERHALDIAEKLYAKNPISAVARRELSYGYEGMGDVFWAMEDMTTAEKHFRQALQMRAQLAEADPVNTQARLDLYRAQVRIARVLFKRGRRAEADRLRREALNALRRSRSRGGGAHVPD